MLRKKVLPCGCTPDSPHLTRREVDVLTLGSRGLPSPAIARALHIDSRTVDQHFQVMLRRANSANRVELIAKCFAVKILVPGSSADHWEPAWSGRRCLDAT
jgi:DNA-binding NarL/FixJ family response regulator